MNGMHSHPQIRAISTICRDDFTTTGETILSRDRNLKIHM
jgi:hypothetical protein